MQQGQHLVDMEFGGQISLCRLQPKNTVGLPIIVAHGTISNGSSVQDLAEHLKEQGFDCWILEWGGHGCSRAASSRNNFESPAFNDTPAAIDYVLKETGHAQLNWVSHSGGGHLPLMYLARTPQCQDKLAGIVAIGAQATDGALDFSSKCRALVLWGVTRVLGNTPKAIVSVGTEGEPTLLLAQWSRWNLSQKWKGADGFDYMSALKLIKTPTLIIAGANDDIAPPTGCRKFFDALGGEGNSWLLCGTANGFSKDYSHGQLIRGRAAKAEVFPRVSNWLIEQSLINTEIAN
ncbi:MAG: alpha/beta fold hydrolase [Bermanella sp.]